MKVLWITNSPLPGISDSFKNRSPEKGWVNSAAYALTKHINEIELGVVSFHSGKGIKEINQDKITHYLIPDKIKINIYSPVHDKYWKQIIEVFAPNIVHIHGSEAYHSYSFVKSCGARNVVLSIQGLVSICQRYYLGNIKQTDLLKSITPRDIFRLDTVFTQKRRMVHRGKFEKELIQKVNHVIGRTSWDKAHTWAINPNINYHFCNETLRPSFFKHKWSLDSCNRYRIFISQGYYPLKGLHQAIKALSIIVKHFPETKVFVAGNNFFTNRGIKLNGYGKYINTLIKRNKLADHIFFTGILDEKEVCQQLLSAHISLCPSAIENSPNSVGESQLLGTPCIASFVGGIPDMIEHEKTGFLYRFEETEILASLIYKLFSNDNLALSISQQSRKSAFQRHNEKSNANALYSIYKEITNA